MSKQVAAQVTTKNDAVVKAIKAGEPIPSQFVHQGYEGAAEDEISVAVEVTVPETFEEAASEDFYGSEQAAMTALGEDWKRRCVNAARPILRTAESPLDWDGVAQTAVDSYKPGRKGGFTARVAEEELDEKFAGEISDEFKAFLRSKGVLK